MSLSFPVAEAENRPKSAHRYNVAEQQVIYKSEVERIWKAQFDSLSRKDEPKLTAEDIEKYERGDQENQKKPSRRQSTLDMKPSTSAMPSPMMMPQTPIPTSPAFSRASSLTREREQSVGPDQRRVLKIKRLINGEWRMEIIRDSAVINAYVKKRQMIEEENTTADALAPTGDAEKDRRAKKRYDNGAMSQTNRLTNLQARGRNC